MGDTRTTENGTDLFLSAEVLWHETPTARIAYRRIGRGPALVFLHGWPLWSFTFRKLLPHLVDHYTCYLIDLPGGGDTVWTRDTDFTWPGQAASVKSLLEEPALGEYFLFGQDSGAMIARHLCLLDGQRIRKFVMTNTEVPGHRPPYLPAYRVLTYLPGASLFTRISLAMGWFLRSDLGFGASLDPELIDGEFRDHIIRPLVRSRYRARGHLRFLRGWSWRVLDHWREFHARIPAPVLLIWGAADRTFPLALANTMAEQFRPSRAEVCAIEGAHLFVHEEQPERVAAEVRRFLSA